MKKAFLFNDCSHCHCGSKQVTENLKELLTLCRYNVISTQRTPRFEDEIQPETKEAILNCDLMVINGEGTMHDNQVAMRRIMRTASWAKEQGKKVILVNSLWNRNETSEFGPDIFDKIYVRDLKSAEEIRRDYRVKVEVLPDIALATRFKFGEKLKRDVDILFESGFYNRELKAKLVEENPWLKETKHCDIMAWGAFPAFCRQIAKAKLVITQRFHTTIACILTRTPFVSFEGNTPKIKGLMDMAAADIPIGHNTEGFQNMLLVAKDNPRQYRKVFDYYSQFTLAKYKQILR